MGNCISSPKNNIIDYIGLDVLYDVLAFLDRNKLAFGVEIACKLFRNIIDRTRLSQIPFLKMHSIDHFNHIYYKLQFCHPKYGGLMKRQYMRIYAKKREKATRTARIVLWLSEKPPAYLRFSEIFIGCADFLKQPTPLTNKFNRNISSRLSVKRINALHRMSHCFEQSKVCFEIGFKLFIQQQLLSNSSSPLDVNNLNLLLEIFLQIFTNCNEIQFWLFVPGDFSKLIVPKQFGLGQLFKNASILNCSNIHFLPKSPFWVHEHSQIPLFDIEDLINWLHSGSGKYRSLSISFNLLNESRQQSDFLKSLLAILSKEMLSNETVPFSYNLLIYHLPKIDVKEFVHQENQKTGEKLILKIGRREYYDCPITNFVQIRRFQ